THPHGQTYKIFTSTHVTSSTNPASRSQTSCLKSHSGYTLFHTDHPDEGMLSTQVESVTHIFVWRLFAAAGGRFRGSRRLCSSSRAAKVCHDPWLSTLNIALFAAANVAAPSSGSHGSAVSAGFPVTRGSLPGWGTQGFFISGSPVCRGCGEVSRRAIKRFKLIGEALGSKTMKIVSRWYCHLYKLSHRRCCSVVSERLSGCNRVGALFCSIMAEPTICIVRSRRFRAVCPHIKTSCGA